MAYLCQFAGKTVLQLALSIFGLLGGPIFAVISLGMFVPYANWLVRLIMSGVFTCFHFYILFNLIGS